MEERTSRILYVLYIQCGVVTNLYLMLQRFLNIVRNIRSGFMFLGI